MFSSYSITALPQYPYMYLMNIGRGGVNIKNLSKATLCDFVRKDTDVTIVVN